MAKVYDRWHLSRPPADAELCVEHSTKARPMYASRDHGIGKRWQVRYRDLAGEQRKENFDKKTQADSRAAEVKAQLDSRTFVNRERGKEKFRAVGERWREMAVHRHLTQGNVERALRLHVYPTFGNRQISSIQTSDIQRWIKDRSQVIKPSSLATPYNCLSGILKMAHHEGIISRYPCDGVKLPEVFYPEVQPLHPDAAKALIEASPDRYRALVRLAAATGLRQGELFGLEDHVTAEGVTVAQQLIGPDKGVPFLGEPKTNQSYRTVPLARSAFEDVQAHCEKFPPRAVRIEDRTDPRKPVWRTAYLLFTNQEGQAIRRGSWSKVWRRILVRANKALEAAGSPVRVPAEATIHDLRHFYASVLIQNGASPKQVQKRLGHAKPSITLNVYTHLWDSEVDKTADMMEAVLS